MISGIPKKNVCSLGICRGARRSSPSPHTSKSDTSRKRHRQKAEPGNRDLLPTTQPNPPIHTLTSAARAGRKSKVDLAVEKELLNRLQQGMYGDIYNFDREAFEKVDRARFASTLVPNSKLWPPEDAESTEYSMTS